MNKSEKNKDIVPGGEQDLVEISDAEQLLMEQGTQKIMSSRVPFKDGRPASIGEKPQLLSFAMMMETCQTADANIALQTVWNAAVGGGDKEEDSCLAEALQKMTELKPQTRLEAMLASQMVAVDTAVGQLMKCAMGNSQGLAGRERNLNLATKLQRTFLQQVDAMQKLRGKGQQKVTVEHVHVHQGGQAVVGNIEQPNGRGEGKNEKE